MSYEYIHRTERMVSPDGTEVIVQLVADIFGSDEGPRENDNFTEIFGESRSLDLTKPPYEHIRVLERIGLVGLNRFMRRFGDPRDGSKVLALKQLDYYEHSGITVYTAEIGTRHDYIMDPGGWDTSHAGYILITQKRWDELGGADPNELVDSTIKIGVSNVTAKVSRVEQVLEAEIGEWDDWLRGNVWGIVATEPCDHEDEHDSDDQIAECPHAPTSDSVWGFIGDPDDVWPDAIESIGVTPHVASVTA